jgi:hypothetical protein
MAGHPRPLYLAQVNLGLARGLVKMSLQFSSPGHHLITTRPRRTYSRTLKASRSTWVVTTTEKSAHSKTHGITTWSFFRIFSAVRLGLRLPSIGGAFRLGVAQPWGAGGRPGGGPPPPPPCSTWGGGGWAPPPGPAPRPTAGLRPAGKLRR